MTRISSILLFLLLLGIGSLLSTHKPFWTDELFTQTQSIENLSYGKILQGQIPEGNNCPLFYLAQKSFTRVLNYRFPLSWENRESRLAEPRSQIILRILPNIFMSASLALLFYFFSIEVSLAAGIFAFGLALASPMIWAYWVEARPYGLWVLLTILQSIIFLRMGKTQEARANLWAWLSTIHILLCFTAVLGVVQTAIVSFLEWGRGMRRLSHYFWATFIPIAIGMFYFPQAPQYQFHMGSLGPLIFPNIAWERWVIFIVFGIILLLARQSRPKISEYLITAQRYLGLLFLYLGATVLILLIFTIRNAPPTVTFAVTNRYFIYLTPLGIMATTLFVSGLIAFYKNKPWIQANIIIFAIGTWLAELIATASAVLSFNIYH